MAAGDTTINATHSAGDYAVVRGTVEVDGTDRDFAIGPTTSYLLYFNWGPTTDDDDAEDDTMPVARINMNQAGTATNGTVSLEAAAAHTWSFAAGIIGVV